MKTSNIILKLSYNIIFIFYKKQYIWALITINLKIYVNLENKTTFGFIK